MSKYLLLSAQRALLGEIMPELRAVSVNYNNQNKILVVNFYYDCTITDAIYDLSSCIITEISADFSPDQLSSIDENILEWRYPQKIPENGVFVYFREEADLQKLKMEETSLSSHETIPIAALLLATQKALLGKVTPQLRQLSVDLDESKKLLFFYFFYDGEISQLETALASRVSIEAQATFPDFQIEKRIVQLDHPEKIPSVGKRIAYMRKE